ncbi:MerR family transcriptional regulator [Actinomyces viscosus]|uniref:MerR family transcriptional regulator n=1 Tax=Actinomyces viscosus TaxID=1656 RepID=UPI0028E5329D|nr:MerR family transcriptional regulator [Actinomyces viscosus]
MRISEAARCAGTTPRMLRYYETQGLLAPVRRDNGYRDYDAGEVSAARQIVVLSHAGFPLSLIRTVLPCATESGALRACPSVAPELRRRLHDVEEQIEALTNSARVIKGFLDNLQDIAPARTAF